MNECMKKWNILPGSLESLKDHILFPFSFFEEEAWRYFTVKGTYFPHMGSSTQTNRKRYKGREQERGLKSRSEKAQ